jgi:hypothetical protein
MVNVMFKFLLVQLEMQIVEYLKEVFVNLAIKDTLLEMEYVLHLIHYVHQLIQMDSVFHVILDIY